MKSRNGFVLIAALWLLVALGAVALDVSLRSRSRRLASANLVDEARARDIAFGGAEYARSRLTSAMLGRAEELRSEAARNQTGRNVTLNFNVQGRGGQTLQVQRANMATQMRDMNSLFRTSDPANDPWRDPEMLVATDTVFGDVPFRLRLRDTGAALNINIADETMLRQFLAQGLELDYAFAERLAQAIMDWRDEDDLPRANGAEREEYIEAGAPVLPPNRQFGEPDEMRFVLGMTAEVFQAIRPFLTVVGNGRINVNAAPEIVLNALPGLDANSVESFVRQRNAGRMPRNVTELLSMLPRTGAFYVQRQQAQFNRRAIYTTDEVEIVSEVVLQGSPVRAEARIIVSRSPTGAQVVWRKID